MRPERPIRLILVGLGNATHPLTRHSIGQIVLKGVAHLAASLPESQGSPILLVNPTRTAWTTLIHLPSPGPAGLELLFVLPRAPMNLSGRAVLSSMPLSFPRSHVLALCDEMGQSPLVVRSRLGGSARGHNGIRSLEKSLGSKDFWRLKVGIGRPEKREDVVQWVMGSLGRDEVRACEWDADGQRGAVIATVWAEVLRIAELSYEAADGADTSTG